MCSMQFCCGEYRPANVQHMPLMWRLHMEINRSWIKMASGVSFDAHKGMQDLDTQEFSVVIN